MCLSKKEKSFTNPTAMIDDGFFGIIQIKICFLVELSNKNGPLSVNSWFSFTWLVVLKCFWMRILAIAMFDP